MGLSLKEIEQNMHSASRKGILPKIYTRQQNFESKYN